MIRRLIILGITMLAVLPMPAQKGMHVETLFDGRFKHDKRAVEVLIKGKELKKYHLTLLYYGFYCFPPQDESYRYLFYRNTSVVPDGGKKPEVTVVYMEGQVTLEELKQMFK